MASPDNFDPIIPIPNDPFGYPNTWDFYSSPSTLIYGPGFTINPVTGRVSVVQTTVVVGTVTQVTAGVGLQTAPILGIRVSGAIARAQLPGAAGAFTNAFIQVDAYGRVTHGSNSPTPIYQVDGNLPIVVSGLAPNFTVSILPGDTINTGSVQLADNLTSNVDTLALTANQGYILNNDIGSINVVTQGQFLAGTYDPVTGKMLTATGLGVAAGYVVGGPLPNPGGAATEGIVIIANTGPVTPPGGTTTYNAIPGDRLYCGTSSYLFLPNGLRYPYATTTAAGLVMLATPADVVGLTNNTKVVTPGSLANFDATTTSTGWVKLASNLETQTLLTPLKVITPANLNALPASVFSRGIVQLDNTLTSTSTSTAPTSSALNGLYQTAMLRDIIQATGDVIVGQSAGVPARLPKGPNGYQLKVDVSAPLGLSWQPYSPPATVRVGTIFWFASNQLAKTPANFVICDGATVSAAPELSPGVPNPYYELFQVIGYTYGGSGLTFNLPDLRGKFIRGWSGSGGTSVATDNPRTFGSTQTSSVITHTHNWTGFGHNHVIVTTAPDHRHKLRAGSVIGPNNGYYGCKDTGNSFMTDGSEDTNLTFTSDNGLTGTYTSLVNTAPTPVNETRPVNFPMVPIIKYTLGNSVLPPAPTPDYYLTSTPSSVGVSGVITNTVLGVNVPRGTTVYWELGGPGITSAFFVPAVTTGSVTIGYNNKATFTTTIAPTLPGPGPFSLEIKLYSDAARLNQVGNTSYVTIT